MGTTIAIRFPLGQYHGTPWDRSVNEGAAEWPPSPWRLLRALVSTWYTRWPELPAPVLDALFEAIGDPPSYLTPHAQPGHTRHYLPDLEHKKGETGGTDLTLDPFLSVRRDAELLIRWDADLHGEQREVLAKLVELVPYLGRAESVCEARLLDEDAIPDETWWRPGVNGAQSARLLSPARPVSRPALEMSTVNVRRSRRTVPPGSVWVSYGVSRPEEQHELSRQRTDIVEAVRFSVFGAAPLISARGILLADDVHRQVGDALESAKIPDERRRMILGSRGAATDHRHAQWIPMAEERSPGSSVQALVLWVRDGLQPEEVASIITVREAHGRRRRRDEEGYEIRGFPELNLRFQAAGPIRQVAPELYGPARRWHSRTPYLPVRHRKRESLDEYVTADVLTELSYRDLPSAVVTPADPDGRLPDRWSRDFRRYRMREHLAQARPGLGLLLEFAEPVTGPLLLGQLSHFGYGIFEPDSR